MLRFEEGQGEQEVESSRSAVRGDYAPGALYGVHGARRRLEVEEGGLGGGGKWRALREV
jgi:hypothetical protein